VLNVAGVVKVVGAIGTHTTPSLVLSLYRCRYGYIVAYFRGWQGYISVWFRDNSMFSWLWE